MKTVDYAKTPFLDPWNTPQQHCMGFFMCALVLGRNAITSQRDLDSVTYFSTELFQNNDKGVGAVRRPLNLLMV